MADKKENLGVGTLASHNRDARQKIFDVAVGFAKKLKGTPKPEEKPTRKPASMNGKTLGDTIGFPKK